MDNTFVLLTSIQNTQSVGNKCLITILHIKLKPCWILRQELLIEGG